jgi:hypothetical protein
MGIELIRSIIVLLKYFFNLMCSSKASNLGTFIGGMGTFILGVASCFGVGSFDESMKQKKMEKRSDIAEEALNRLDILKKDFDEWCPRADSWFVYSRRSTENVQQLNALDSDKQKEFLNTLDNDPDEVSNYIKRGDAILNELRGIKNKVIRLSDLDLINEINELISEIEKIIKRVTYGVSLKHFPVANASMKAQAVEILQKKENEIEPLYNSVQKRLSDILMFASKI